MQTPSIDPRIAKLNIRESTKIKGYSFVLNGDNATTSPVEPLGLGGSSVVYKVYQELDANRKIYVPRALKLFVMREDLNPIDVETSFLPAHANFLEEIQNISQFTHENLVQVTDAGEHDFILSNDEPKKVPYLVTHLILGCTLREVIEGKPNAEFARKRLRKDPRLAIELIGQITKGLSYLHSRNFLHCDIAPKNIFIEDGQQLRAIVGDVGMSRHVDGNSSENIFIAGTKSYAPEDIAALFGSEVDGTELAKWFPLWDLYGFSKTIKELLLCVSKLSPTPWLNAAVDKATQAHESIDRFASAKELSERIEYCLPIYRERGGVPELEPSAVMSRKRMMPIEALAFTPRIDKLVRHPALMRLQSVPQLTIMRSASPGGSHSRYEHALGVMENVRRMLSTLIDEPSFLGVLGREAIETGLVAGVLYNATRFPFSNTIHELNKRLPLGDKKIFESFSRGGLFEDIFGSQFKSLEGLTLEDRIKKDFPSIEISKLKRILTANTVTELTEPDEAVLYTLLNSSLDARVIDFVRRDSLHLGLSSGDFFDLDDLLPHLIISSASAGFSSQVSLKTTGVTVAEQIILMRYWLYQRVYWNQPNRAYNAAIRRAVLDLQEINEFEQKLREKALHVDEREMILFLHSYATEKGLASTAELLDLVKGHEKLLYREIFVRNLRQCESDPIQQDTEHIETLIDKEMSYKTMQRFEKQLDSWLASQIKVTGSSAAPLVLLDVPFEPGNIKLGADIFVSVQSASDHNKTDLKNLKEVSPVIAGVNQNFIKELQRLRIFIRPDIELDKEQRKNIGSDLYLQLRQLIDS